MAEQFYDDETTAEREARIATEVILDEDDKKFVDDIVTRLLDVCDELSGHPFYPYQRPLAYRILESLVINDGARISALWSRQSGKTETISNAIATAMIMLPVLARIFPRRLAKFREGVWVGAFAPTDDLAKTLYERIANLLLSEKAAAIMSDPEIDDVAVNKGKTIMLKRSGSLVRRTGAHPRAMIEGKTYHVILIDESQFADDTVINKSVAPMGAATRASMVFTGTATKTKNVFYDIIQDNKRREAQGKSAGRRLHFQTTWRDAGKYNKNYMLSVQDEMQRLGEDSDEFKLSYKCIWLLDQGMFTTEEKLESCGDTSMQSLVHAYNRTPVVVGIDCGRKQDRTVVTVVFVDWDNPDPFGLYHHRILNWLDLEGMDWEEQYFRIVEFLANYRVWKIGIDAGGLGDVVAQRLRLLLPGVDVVDQPSDQGNQSRRWKHLLQLIDRQQIAYPHGSKVRKLKVHRRFIQEMQELQLKYKGPHMLAEAPTRAYAHDDYPDSLALACILTLDEGDGGSVEVYDNPFY